mgnify:CR=1 FL=1
MKTNRRSILLLWFLALLVRIPSAAAVEGGDPAPPPEDPSSVFGDVMLRLEAGQARDALARLLPLLERTEEYAAVAGACQDAVKASGEERYMEALGGLATARRTLAAQRRGTDLDVFLEAALYALSVAERTLLLTRPPDGLLEIRTEEDVKATLMAEAQLLLAKRWGDLARFEAQAVLALEDAVKEGREGWSPRGDLVPMRLRLAQTYARHGLSVADALDSALTALVDLDWVTAQDAVDKDAVVREAQEVLDAAAPFVVLDIAGAAALTGVLRSLASHPALAADVNRRLRLLSAACKASAAARNMVKVEGWLAVRAGRTAPPPRAAVLHVNADCQMARLTLLQQVGTEAIKKGGGLDAFSLALQYSDALSEARDSLSAIMALEPLNWKPPYFLGELATADPVDDLTFDDEIDAMYEKGVTFAETAARLGHDVADAQYHAARLLHRLEKAKAAGPARRFLELAPADPRAPEMKALLEEPTPKTE